MNLGNKTINLWTLITIADDKGLPGKSIYDVIQILRKAHDFNFIVLNDIVGAQTSCLVDKENITLNIDEILESFLRVVQFDWGNFFLFSDRPKKWKASENKLYEMVNASDTTVRAVDDGYIYIYTPFQNILEIIKKNYEIESITTKNVKDLDYPF